MEIVPSVARRRLSNSIRLILIIVGLVLVFVGNAITPSIYMNVRWHEVVATFGVFVSVVVTLQWVFDEKSREELLEDIVKAAVGAERVARSGISDILEESKKLSYDEVLKTPGDIVICMHYSPRLIEDNYDAFRRRPNNLGVIKVLVLADDCSALRYLKDVRKEGDHIEPNISKLLRYCNDLKVGGVAISVHRFDAVLRYSFVLTDSYVWVKFYRNSTGLSAVPAMKISYSSPLYRFFRTDIDGVLGASVLAK